jgi:hypothetical protein
MEDKLPPNGGYGWVVVAGSFAVHFVTLGLQYSFGVLYTALLDEFQQSRGDTAWIGSLSIAFMLLSGTVPMSLLI